MKMLSPKKATHRTSILRINILIGFIVFLVSTILMINGEYSTLAERREADHIYNLVSIGSLAYMAIVWFSCIFSKPFWKPGSANK